MRKKIVSVPLFILTKCSRNKDNSNIRCLTLLNLIQEKQGFCWCGRLSKHSSYLSLFLSSASANPKPHLISINFQQHTMGMQKHHVVLKTDSRGVYWIIIRNVQGNLSSSSFVIKSHDPNRDSIIAWGSHYLSWGQCRLRQSICVVLFPSSFILFNLISGWWLKG